MININFAIIDSHFAYTVDVVILVQNGENIYKIKIMEETTLCKKWLDISK